jgi:1,2-phenylacetyl-CoA epoxidase PaaB subunit
MKKVRNVKKMQPTDNQQVAKSLFSAPIGRVFVWKKKKAQKVFMRFVKNNPILTVLWRRATLVDLSYI